MELYNFSSKRLEIASTSLSYLQAKIYFNMNLVANSFNKIQKSIFAWLLQPKMVNYKTQLNHNAIVHITEVIQHLTQ